MSDLKIEKMVFDIKDELERVFTLVFDNIETRHDRSYVNAKKCTTLIDGSTQADTRYATRDRMKWHAPHYIYINGSVVAHTQRKPHKMVKIINDDYNEKYITNLMVRVLHDQFPEVKVIHE